MRAPGAQSCLDLWVKRAAHSKSRGRLFPLDREYLSFPEKQRSGKSRSGGGRGETVVVEISRSESAAVTNASGILLALFGEWTLDHRLPVKAFNLKLLSVLLGLKFYAGGGLMVDSIADSEEDAQDGSSRFIKNFRPLGYSFFSVLAGPFNVHQELFECSLEPHGVVATIRMSFSPSNSKDHEPTGSFLWDIEPDRANE
jgi:hypothetical protein